MPRQSLTTPPVCVVRFWRVWNLPCDEQFISFCFFFGGSASNAVVSLRGKRAWWRRRDAEVCCVARNKEDLEQVARACAEQGWKVQAEVLDVLDRKGVDRFLSSSASFDVLVNNAGTNAPQPFLEVEEEVYDRIMDLNLRAVFFLSQSVARGMRERGGGSIIHVSSQMGRVGGEQRTAYCAAKHGIEGLTKGMSVSIGMRAWLVFCDAVASNFVETALDRERAAVLLWGEEIGRVRGWLGGRFLCLGGCGGLAEW